MLTYFKRRLARIVMCLSLLTLSVGCAPMLTLDDLVARNPSAHAGPICDRPAGVGPQVRLWAYNKTLDTIVTDEDRFALLAFAETAHSFHEYSPSAPASSTQDMPGSFGIDATNICT